MLIRSARAEDLSQLLAIRNHYILNSRALYEEVPETPESGARWRAKYRESGPHQMVVAEDAGQILGYATSSPFREGICFQETVEGSIYVAPGAEGRGLGEKLYAALFERLRGHAHTMLVGIGLPNEASVALHRRFGFREIGLFQESAKKRGQYLNTLLMQRMIEP